MICFYSLGISNGCTFEDANICGYTQGKRDNFDWTRANGKTASANTGPPQDHTYGTAAGYYMYIEASRPRTRGQKARLITTDNPSTNGACLQFYYHMYGSSMGTLNLYAQSGGQLGRPIFSRSGNQGNKWIVGRVTVKSQATWQVSTDSYRKLQSTKIGVFEIL